MKITTTLLRQISILSGLLGGILGIITILPYIGALSFTFLICFVSAVIIWILVEYNCITVNEMKDGIITGAIIGFISYIAFSITFIPLSIILMKIFSYASNFGIGLMLENANLFLLMVISLFLALVSATINAFTGLLTFYIIDIIESSRRN